MRKSNSSLMIISGIGIICVALMCVFFAINNTGNNNSVTSEEAQNQELKKIGIEKELNEDEEENIEALTDAMSYLSTKYGSGNYTYENYERIDEITEYISVVDSDGTKFVVMRQNIGGNYIYTEVEE